MVGRNVAMVLLALAGMLFAEPAKNAVNAVRSCVLIHGEDGDGTGFLVRSPDGKGGEVVTCNHVILEAGHAVIRDMDGHELKWSRVHSHPKLDLAWVPIDGGLPEGAPCLAVAKSVTALPLESPIVCYGDSNGEGVVVGSAGRLLGIGPENIEVDAQMVMGNSGGPIVNAQGEVLAVASHLIELDDDKEWEVRGTRFAKGEGRPARRFAIRLDNVRRVGVPAYSRAAVDADAARYLKVSEAVDKLTDLLDELEGEEEKGKQKGEKVGRKSARRRRIGKASESAEAAEKPEEKRKTPREKIEEFFLENTFFYYPFEKWNLPYFAQEYREWPEILQEVSSEVLGKAPSFARTWFSYRPIHEFAKEAGRRWDAEHVVGLIEAGELKWDQRYLTSELMGGKYTILHAAAICGELRRMCELARPGNRHWTPGHCAELLATPGSGWYDLVYYAVCTPQPMGSEEVRFVVENGPRLKAVDKDLVEALAYVAAAEPLAEGEYAGLYRGQAPAYAEYRRAFEDGRLKMLEYLVKECGVPTEARLSAFFNSHWSTALTLKLVELGAKVDFQRADDHLTPLHYACSAGRTEVVKALLEKGASVSAESSAGVASGNFTFRAGDTPLHCAMRAPAAKALEIARLLLENGADINAKNADGDTPCDLARDAHRLFLNDTRPLREFLKARGAR